MTIPMLALVLPLLLAIAFWGSILVAFFYGIRLLIKWLKKKYDEL